MDFLLGNQHGSDLYKNSLRESSSNSQQLTPFTGDNTIRDEIDKLTSDSLSKNIFKSTYNH